MTDYNKQTVAQLRTLLKDRGIPSTGLTRKAQIIEKLEEADQSLSGESQAGEHVARAPNSGRETSNDAPTSTAPQTQPMDDAPLNPANEVDNEEVVPGQSEEAPGPPIAEAGEPPARPLGPSETATPTLPDATIDANRETVSHIDSDIPPPDQMSVVEHSAEDTTADNEPATIQPSSVYNAAPADPEDVVGPKVTEPADEEVKSEQEERLANNELPHAPGPAAEALRFAKQDQQVSKEALELAAADKAASLAEHEEPSVEKAELLTIPEGSTAETSRLNSEELEMDSKKRKRRSLSPSIPSQDIRAKKRKPSQEPVPEVYLKEDGDVVMEQRSPDGNDVDVDVDSRAAVPTSAHEPDTKTMRKEKTDRYRTLIDSGAGSATQDALHDDRPVAPALHPATPALYIRNFMRPLRPEQLRTHLASLASPPSGSPDASVIQSLFLDAMKTHALVLLSSTTAASRVRASLHGSIWPPEGNRKELWVDFIPEDSVEDWIRQEEDAIAAEKEARLAGRPIPAKRFEVYYPDNDTAVFQEVGSSGAPLDAPRGPRGSMDIRRPSQPVAPTPDTRQDIAASFKTLDQLFSSTTAKPHLYFLPVSDEIAELRLKELENETSRDWAPGETRKGRGIKTEMTFKYSFDEDDRIVEVGGAEDHRGGRGGFRGRGRGGGFRGGRGGGNWRG
ncbi:hypothetical protein FB567DRAFT_596726 [Paraphoma chrysanthemicola]|uniref:SAP domain-containing protein n=1 Tax=Paraphoma chrysanthemicola TaxID=798071 RepID=A0A8K0QYE3_9PLEO|nr:hypothetical protein FB567DRAFT_596726 [Paraphoma chrysanthemicola]